MPHGFDDKAGRSIKRRVEGWLAGPAGSTLLALLKPRTITVFFALMFLFIVGLSLATFGNRFASPALLASVEVLAIVLLIYGLLTFFFPTKSHRLGDADLHWSRYAFWSFFGIMVGGVAVLLIFAPTTASQELLKRFFITGYTSGFSDSEVRLSTSFMPVWAQIVFEVARRFAAPYCLLTFFFTPVIAQNRKRVGTALLFLLAVFVLSTLDRAIPVFYFAMAITGLFLIYGLVALKNKYVYLNALAIIAVVVLFKNIQYGEIRGLQFSPNSDIVRSLTQESEQDKPAADQEQAAPRSKPALVATKPAGPGSFDYICYVTSSMIERILLSPMAMTLYAVRSYDESNFQHWSTTRLLSFIGLARFIDPFEKGTQKYHDAFPVTFIGDLWRNGGFQYIPYYAVFLALVLFLVDRRIMTASGMLQLQVLSLFGVLYLFYGNAFNATSWLMISGSLILGEFFHHTKRRT